MANRESTSSSPGSRRKHRGTASERVKKKQVMDSRLTRDGKRLLAIQTTLSSLFRRASPKSLRRDISWMSVDLAGLWEVSKTHQSHIRRLLKCSYPEDRDRIQLLVTEIQINWLSQAVDHLKTLNRILPRVRSMLYRVD